jgi:phage-related protein
VRADLLHALIYLGENFIVKPLTALYNLLGLVKTSIIDVGRFILSHITVFFNDIFKGLTFIATVFTSALRNAANFIVRPFVAMWDGIQKVFVPPINVIKTILNYIFGGIKDVINAIRGVTNIGGDIKSIPSKIGGAVTGFFSGLAHLASGGSIISSGLAVVHKGENVIPAGASLNNGNGTTNITLHMTVNGVTDVRDLVDKVQKEIEKRTGRMLRWST